MHLPEKLINWTFNILHGRELFVKYNNKLFGPRLSYKSVSQGGILSSMLFILYIHQLNLVLGSDVSNLEFADDSSVVQVFAHFIYYYFFIYFLNFSSQEINYNLTALLSL